MPKNYVARFYTILHLEMCQNLDLNDSIKSLMYLVWVLDIYSRIFICFPFLQEKFLRTFLKVPYLFNALSIVIVCMSMKKYSHFHNSLVYIRVKNMSLCIRKYPRLRLFPWISIYSADYGRVLTHSRIWMLIRRKKDFLIIVTLAAKTLLKKIYHPIYFIISCAQYSETVYISRIIIIFSFIRAPELCLHLQEKQVCL